VRNRNFINTSVDPRFLVGSMPCLILVFCVMFLFCLIPSMSYVHNVACVSGMSILEMVFSNFNFQLPQVSLQFVCFHLKSIFAFSGACVTRSLVLCVCFIDRVVVIFVIILK